MFLILLQTVTIIPELTLVFIHLLIFLFVLISLNYLIFKPVFKIFNKRKELTETTNIKTDGLIAETKKMNDEYNEIINAMRNKGTFIQQELLKQAEESKREIILKTKTETQELLQKKRSEIIKTINDIKNNLQITEDHVTNVIVSKILNGSKGK